MSRNRTGYIPPLNSEVNPNIKLQRKLILWFGIVLLVGTMAVVVASLIS